MYAAAFFKFQSKEIDRISRLVREGVSVAELLGKQKDTLFGFRRPLKNELLNNLTQTRNFGMGQVRDELDRQHSSSEGAAA